MLEEIRHSSQQLEQQKFDLDSDFNFDLVDIVRFFSANRSKLLARFSLSMLVCLTGLFIWRTSRSLRVQGRLNLNFRGIERGEYPDGRKFSIENLRSPDVISMALVDAKIAQNRTDAAKLSPEVDIQPIIPRTVALRWAKQEKDGVPREEYFPNEFMMSIALAGLPPDTGLHFFNAIVKRYRESEKTAQLSALRIASNGSQSNFYGNLLQDPKYDYGDVVQILDSSVGPFKASLIQMLANDSDPALQTGLKDIQNDLSVWSMTQLETLKALTYGTGMVKNKDVAAARVRYRLSDYNIRIQQKAEETSEAFKLLAAVQRPQRVLIERAGKEMPLPADTVGLEQLINNNYVALLVKRISELQHEVKALEAEKLRLERDAALIAQARPTDPGRLPDSYRSAVIVASKELEQIIDRYNAVVYQHLTAVIVNAIILKEEPVIVREGPSVKPLLALLCILCGLLTIIWVFLETTLYSAGTGRVPIDGEKAKSATFG